MTTTLQDLKLKSPAESTMYVVPVTSGLYAGKWLVDSNPIRIEDGRLFEPQIIREKMIWHEYTSFLDILGEVQTYEPFVKEGFEAIPASVLIAGFTRYGRKLRGLMDHTTLTGSAIIKKGNKYLLGTPKLEIERGSGANHFKMEGLREDRPIAYIEFQNGRVSNLDTTTFWGISEESLSEKPHFWKRRERSEFDETQIKTVDARGNSHMYNIPPSYSNERKDWEYHESHRRDANLVSIFFCDPIGARRPETMSVYGYTDPLEYSGFQNTKIHLAKKLEG